MLLKTHSIVMQKNVVKIKISIENHFQRTYYSEITMVNKKKNEMKK